jgi:hypothetical protein
MQTASPDLSTASRQATKVRDHARNPRAPVLHLVKPLAFGPGCPNALAPATPPPSTRPQSASGVLEQCFQDPVRQHQHRRGVSTSPTRVKTRERFSFTSGTAISSTPCDIPSLPPAGSGIFRKIDSALPQHLHRHRSHRAHWLVVVVFQFAKTPDKVSAIFGER